MAIMKTHDTDGPSSQVPLLHLANGFISFKTFSVALELELFTKLAGGQEMTVDEFSAELDLQARPTRLLLAACASLGLLDKAGDRYRNSALAEKYLVSGRPHYFGGFVRFCDRKLYWNWHRVMEALRTNSPVTWNADEQDGAFSADDDIIMETFWEAMHSLAGATANALAEVYDFGQHQRLLDVGGGSGGFPIELCQQTPGLTAAVYDLPHVCPIAAKKVQDAGLHDRIETIPGNFQADPALPAGFDVMLLSSVLHDHDEMANRRLLDKVFAALEPGGAVLVCELLLNDERTGPPAAALMGMNMLVGLPRGENYAESEYGGWLADAGFTDVRVVRFEAAGANGAVVARKPLAD
jgi:ubiquinone/menaquinone biosynthesis C-methylase UbiE